MNSTYNSLGYCSQTCSEAGRPFFAVQGIDCACLDTLPSNDEKVDMSQCNLPCPGYPSEMCESKERSEDTLFVTVSIAANIPRFVGGGQSGYYSVGAVSGILVTTSSAPSSSISAPGTLTTTVNDNVTTPIISSQTTSATVLVSPSGTSSNDTVTVTSISPSGSSGSASSTVGSSAAGTPIFSKGATVVASVFSAVAVLVALM